MRFVYERGDRRFEKRVARKEEIGNRGNETKRRSTGRLTRFKFHLF